MILRIADRKKLLAPGIDARAIDRIPEFIRQALTLEPQIREVAKKIAPFARIVLFGAGVGWPTAREGALKIKESCYIAAEDSKRNKSSTAHFQKSIRAPP